MRITDADPDRHPNCGSNSDRHRIPDAGPGADAVAECGCGSSMIGNIMHF